MQTIYQETSLGYNRVSISDVIVMLPVMDKIMSDYKWNLKRYNAEQDKTSRKYYHEDAQKQYNQLKVMYQLGFVPTSGEDLLPLPTLEEAEEEAAQ